MSYPLHILVMIGLYIILGLSLNVITGYLGILSLCHGAFYGIGAYGTTLLMMKCGWGFLPALLVAVVACSLLSIVVGLPSLRLRGDFFMLATMGFQLIIYAVLYNWVEVTRGPYGIPGIPHPIICGHELSTVPEFSLAVGVTAALCALLCWQLARSPFGRVLRAIRDDEMAAVTLGKNVFAFKLVAFVMAAGIAAVAGAFYAVYVTYIDPTAFGLDESVFIVAVVVIGGAGNMTGPVAGAVFMVALPEVLKLFRVPDSIAPNVRQIVYGALLILAMRFRPQGLAGRYAFN